MDNNKLAELLFPHIDRKPEDYEKLFPKREMPEGAMVTRLGPSPTGFIHLGNLYGAFVDERLAHQSGGTFYLSKKRAPAFPQGKTATVSGLRTRATCSQSSSARYSSQPV